MHTLSLSQAVQEATHTTSNGRATLLDLAFVSQISQLRQCEVIPPIGNSDHCGLIVDWKWKASYSHPRPRPSRRQIWRYAHADFDKANEMLSNTEWDLIIDSSDINQSLSNWEQCFMNVMAACIPKGMLPKKKNLPWMSKNIHRTIMRRNNMYKRAKSSGPMQVGINTRA